MLISAYVRQNGEILQTSEKFRHAEGFYTRVRLVTREYRNITVVYVNISEPLYNFRDNYYYTFGSPPEFLAKPPRPSEYAIFTNGTWEIDGAEVLRVVRTRRNELLAASDWSMTVDSPIQGNQNVLDYRQALRDLPSQIVGGTPIEDVVWPTEPLVLRLR